MGALFISESLKSPLISHFSFSIFILWSKFVSQAVRGGSRRNDSFLPVYTLLIDIEFLLLVYFFLFPYYASLIFFHCFCILLMYFIVMWMNEINIELN